MFTKLYKRLKKYSKARNARRKAGGRIHAPFHLEQLEDRLVPTISFSHTLYGLESVAAGSTNVGLQNPTVNLIFAGNWTNYQQQESSLIGSVRSIVSGPYLSALTQYSTSGTATFGTSWSDPNTQANATLPAFPNTTQLQLFLQNSISTYGADPGVNDSMHAPIYVVVLDPATSAGDNGGFNVPGQFTNSSGQQENIHMIFVGVRQGI